ncbi:MAG: hypothetical protein RLZZ385_612 [Pseudomonadota bacterium]|jgi:tRNA dimethylallyltransferase
MGPTAAGKTDLAAELVQQLPMEIISVDSAQVYRGMDIGTGKPDAALLARAPHRLIDIRDPADPYSAADFRSDALAQIDDILAQGRIPLLVGGTMLYFRVLRDGLAAMPTADAQVRREIEALALQSGWEAVHQRLAEVDPQAARRIHPNDPQRLQRALEVYRVSGRTLTSLHHEEQRSRQTGAQELPFTLHFMAIQPAQRDVLHRRIADRFIHMLDAGFVEEVEQLYRRGDLDVTLPSIRSVGYRQIWQFLAGEMSYDDMVEKGIIATRQLAKRQLTWLRSWNSLHSLGTESDQTFNAVLQRALKTVEAVSI